MGFWTCGGEDYNIFKLEDAEEKNFIADPETLQLLMDILNRSSVNLTWNQVQRTVFSVSWQNSTLRILLHLQLTAGINEISNKKIKMNVEKLYTIC